MSRKLWILAAGCALMLVLLCAGGVGGYFAYRNRQTALTLERADAHYAAGR